jgi:hypothetical protein
MSLTSDIVERLINLIGETLPEYSAQDGYTPVESLDDGALSRLPVVMIFDPTLATEELPFQQRRETITVRLFLIRVQDGVAQNALQIRDDVEALRTAVDGDAALEALTDNIYTAAWEHHEDGKRHVIADTVIEAQKVVN